MVNAILSEELSSKGGSVHALSIIAKSPSQWNEMKRDINGDVMIDASPRCRGGDGSIVSKE